MDKLPCLYKRSKTGAIVSWQVWTDTVDSAGSQFAVIFKETGQLNGKKTVHKEEIHEGKNIGRSNETTSLGQARSQAESDWKRQKDNGYKGLRDLGLIVVDYEGNQHDQPEDAIAYRNADDVIVHTTVERFLEDTLPRYNSDANGMTKPMLAKAVNWDKVTYPCYVQPKLDGVRCLLVVEPNTTSGDPIVKFLSRTGKEYTTLGHIAADASKYGPNENYILDGEIYSDYLTFQEIVAAVKKQRPDSLKLKFRCYDIVSDSDQLHRVDEFRAIIGGMRSIHLTTVETWIVRSKEEVLQHHDAYVEYGYEGAIIRLMDGHYGQGQRSSHLLKVKEFQTDEFKLLDFQFGQRGVEDLIAICEVSEGITVKPKMTGTKAYKEKLWAWWSEELAETEHMLTVKFFGFTDEGSLRFPVGVAVRDYE